MTIFGGVSRQDFGLALAGNGDGMMRTGTGSTFAFSTVASCTSEVPDVVVRAFAFVVSKDRALIWRTVGIHSSVETCL